MFFKKKTLSKPQLNAFISIGAGTNQTSLIRAAKNKGFKLVGVDANSMSAGLPLCDLRIHESIYDYENIYKALREALFDIKVIAIMTRSFGEAVKTTAFLCEKFSIPYLPFNICDNFTNKSIMKNSLTKNGIKTPETVRLSASSKTAKLKDFAAIVKKPVNGHAKQGIKLIKTPKEYQKELSSNTKKNFIFEKYIQGDEIIAVGLVNNGRYYLADVTDKITSNETPFIDIMHISPSKYTHLWDRIAEIGQSVSDTYNITSAPLIIEFIVDKNESLYIIEAVPEFGGEFLADTVIPQGTGYNFIEEAINSQIGFGFTPPQPKKKRKAVAVHYLTAKEGNIQSWDKNAAIKTKGVFYFDMFKARGTKLKTLASNLDRVGVIITSGKTAEQAVNSAKQAAVAANIQVTQ